MTLVTTGRRAAIEVDRKATLLDTSLKREDNILFIKSERKDKKDQRDRRLVRVKNGGGLPFPLTHDLFFFLFLTREDSAKDQAGFTRTSPI
jgi:hypothetical protein